MRNQPIYHNYPPQRSPLWPILEEVRVQRSPTWVRVWMREDRTGREHLFEFNASAPGAYLWLLPTLDEKAARWFEQYRLKRCQAETRTGRWRRPILGRLARWWRGLWRRRKTDLSDIPF